MKTTKAPICINWDTVFGRDSPSREVRVVPAASASASDEGETAARELERLSDHELRKQVRRLRSTRPEFARMLSDGGPKLRRRLENLEAELHRRNSNTSKKDGEACKLAAQSNTRDPFTFDISDELDSDNKTPKFHLKSSSVPSMKKNYGQLGIIVRRRLRKAGQMRSISVDKMYSSKPCFRTAAGHKQRIHAIDPKEADHKNCLKRQNDISNNFIKRRKASKHHDSSYFEFEKVQDVVLLDDEDAQPAESVDSEMPDRWEESKIYYPSRDDSEAVVLTYSDIKCLDPAVYLSSPVINFYIQYLKRFRSPEGDHRDNFYIFNTYFYSKLEEALLGMGEFSKLRRWWKGVDIFQKAYIILPIHGKMHWSLIIICIPAKESDSGPTILHLDSLGLHSSAEFFHTIERYLEAEWCYLRQNALDIPISGRIWKDLPSSVLKEKIAVPQQKNEYDCGIFMLYYIERFMRDAPKRFRRGDLDKFGRTWFKPEEASELRQRIRALLLEEFESVRLEDAVSEAAALSDSSKSDEEIIEGGVPEATTLSDSSTSDEEIVKMEYQKPLHCLTVQK